MNNHTLSQHDCDYNNYDMSSEYGFIKSPTLYQCDESSAFKDIYGYAEICDVSNGYCSINNNTVYQQNGPK